MCGYCQQAPRTAGPTTESEVPPQFPARDVDEPVSREHFDRRLAELTNDLTTRMLTIAGLGLAAITALLAAFT